MVISESKEIVILKSFIIKLIDAIIGALVSIIITIVLISSTDSVSVNLVIEKKEIRSRIMNYHNSFTTRRPFLESNLIVYLYLAKKGNSLAQFRLSTFYEYGFGLIPKNNAKSRRWLFKSAKQGNYKAQGKLAKNYRYGRLFKKNDTLAYMWYYIASQNSSNAPVLHYKVLGKSLDSETINNAIEKAGRCLESNYTNNCD